MVSVFNFFKLYIIEFKFILILIINSFCFKVYDENFKLYISFDNDYLTKSKYIFKILWL